MTAVETPTPEPTDQDLQALRSQLWARAHHEAAHAVVGTLLGGRVLEVAIWSGPPVHGRVQVSDLDDESAARFDHGLVRRIAYLLAGPIAEQIATSPMGMIQNEAASFAATTVMLGIRDPDRIEQGTDLGAVAALIVEYFGPDGEAPAAAAADHLPLSVEGLVRDHWSAVQLVVAGLLRQGRLTEEEFHALVTRALPAAASTDLFEALPERSEPHG